MIRACTTNLPILLTSTCLALSLAAVGCSGEDGSSGGASGSTSTSTSASAGSGGSGGSGSASAGNGGSGGSSGSGDAVSSSAGTGGSSAGPSLSFFVSSTGSTTADLGGLAGADKRCLDLATAVGAGMRTWRAYLSADDGPVHAKDRIGQGPWYNAKLELVATDLEDLHTRAGDFMVFLDEKGEPINGQWANSPKPNQHDILTGSNKDGTLMAGKTCNSWTSADAALFAWVGHSDGLGPMMNAGEPYKWWNSVHENGGCHDTAPKGGAGKVYCFAAD